MGQRLRVCAGPGPTQHDTSYHTCTSTRAQVQLEPTSALGRFQQAGRKVQDVVQSESKVGPGSMTPSTLERALAESKQKGGQMATLVAALPRDSEGRLDKQQLREVVCSNKRRGTVTNISVCPP